MRVGVSAPGLGKLRRDLGRIDKSLRKAADAHIRATAKQVRDEAAGRAPVGTAPKPARERLSRSYRYSLRRGSASVYSRAPHAGVHEFGGTIAPRGIDIEIEKSAPIYGAIASKAAHIEEELGTILDVIADANGFRRSVDLGFQRGASPISSFL